MIPSNTRTLRIKAIMLASTTMPNLYTYVTVVMRGKRATVTLWGEEDENFTMRRTGKLRLTREGKGWRVLDVRTSSPSDDLDWSQALDGPTTPDDVADPTWGA